MQKSFTGLQRLTNFTILALIVGYLLVIGKALILPIAFAFLFALLLKPITAFIERYLHQRHTAIILSFLVALIPVIGAALIFSYQLVTIIDDIPAISSRVNGGLNEVIHWLERTADLSLTESRQWILDNFSTIVDTPLQLLTSSLTSSTTILASLLLSTLITFFILLYRTSFRNFLLVQFRPSLRDEVATMISDMQRVVQQYLYGMLLVILILGVLNSTGLWLIGIRYAVFWGFLAAFLAIIPYIGTTLGGMLPFLYALATADTMWQPLAVVAFYFAVQNIEGNFITPKVVGGSVNLNPLVAILSLLFWGFLWGVAGLILALPIMAILKVVISHVDALRPLSVLFSDGLYTKKDIFFQEYDAERFRIGQLFRKRD